MGVSRHNLVVLRYCENDSLMEVVDLATALAECNVDSKLPSERREFSVDLEKRFWSYKDACGDETCKIGAGALTWKVPNSQPLAVIGVFDRSKIHDLDHMVDHALAMKVSFIGC